MKTDKKMETKGAVTPKMPIARRSQTTSYIRLQNPEMKNVSRNKGTAED